jgi:uridine phosphorylase
MGMDGLLFFYENNETVTDEDLARQFSAHTRWDNRLATPYFVSADQELAGRIGYDMVKGITISANGFYAPQGRRVRLNPNRSDQNRLIESFEYQGKKITNYEMESAALAGLARLMGHQAVTVCLIIAGRYAGTMKTDYQGSFSDLIVKVLDRI